MSFQLHRGDLPATVSFGASVAVDTETTGLSLFRDRLCTVQLSAGHGEAHIVQVGGDIGYECPNLKKIMADPGVLKIFHFARFDVAMMKRWLNVDVAPVYCTKIASLLSRTNTERHSLKDVVSTQLGIHLDKEQQTSDWAGDNFSKEQLAYAANDVLYLHEVKSKLDALLEREGRTHIAQACFNFLPTRAEMDLLDWEKMDIFSHDPHNKG